MVAGSPTPTLVWALTVNVNSIPSFTVFVINTVKLVCKSVLATDCEESVVP